VLYEFSKKHGLTCVKPTQKPGLNSAQKKARLQFCLKHEDWTIEDWKRVIWSDETSVILGQRRGTIRLWRASGEAYKSTCIRNRWKVFSEFMFWACFTWDSKGPSHIWTTETAQEKKQAEIELTKLNALLEPKLKLEWELTMGVNRINLRRRPAGRKPQWRFNEKNGKLVRKERLVESIGIGIGSKFSFQSSFLSQKNVLKRVQIRSFKRITQIHTLINIKQRSATCTTFLGFYGLEIRLI
jgi:hypothetical protein